MGEWKRCRDAVGGTDPVKLAGTEYLPRLRGQTYVDLGEPGFSFGKVDEYEVYKKRANWMNVSGLAVSEMLGALFRTPPVFDVPEPMKPHLDDITLAGESAESFAKRLAGEDIKVGFFGVRVDMPMDISTPRPYWIGYHAEQILRRRMVNIDGVWMLGQLVLEECTIEDGQNEFEDEEVTRYRVLQLDEAGYLIDRPFEIPKGRSEPVELETIYPNVRGQRFRQIPFVFFGWKSLSPEPDNSPILDLVDLNYSHYRTSADLEEALYYLAVPTPYAAGFDPEKELRLGARVAYQSSEPQAHIEYAEFKGSGLSELRTALEHKEAQMDAIRARLMARQKGGIESAEAIRLRTSGEQNVLMTLSSTISQGLTRLLGYHAEWMALRNAAVSAAINDDFVDNTMTPQQQAENRADHDGRKISWATYYWRMQKGELMRPGITAEEELAEIEAEQTLAGEIDIPNEPNNQSNVSGDQSGNQGAAA